MGFTDSRSHMSDAEFLRHVAHTADIGDLIDEHDIERLRRIADGLNERDS